MMAGSHQDTPDSRLRQVPQHRLSKGSLTAVGACRWRRYVRWRTSGRSARWHGRSAALSWPSAPTGASCAFTTQRRYVLTMGSLG